MSSAVEGFAGDRRRLLIELTILDQTYRWENRDTSAGDSLSTWPLLEKYVSAFPELGPVDELPAEVIANEYRVRSRAGDRPEHAEYLRRFGCSNALAVALRSIDDSAATRLVTNAAPSLDGSCSEQPPQIGRFKLLERVGSGAFGAVYRALDTEPDRVVAIKTPRSGVFQSNDEKRRFVREGRVAAQLRNPGIVSVLEVDINAGTPYIVSEFVDGPTLADALRQGAFAPENACKMFAAIADSLEHAHVNGVIHRDLKPSNIMIDPDRGPRIMDFGLAKWMADNENATMEGDLLRDAGVYGSRAGSRRSSIGRPADRYLCARSDPLRMFDRRASIRWPSSRTVEFHCDGPAFASAHAESGHITRSLNHLPQVH